MKLKVVGSGSKGNCYIVHNDEEALIIECGVRMKDIKEALDFKLGKVVGCLVTHSHQDHCKGAKEVLAAGIDIHCLKETSDAIGISSHRIRVLEPENAFNVGNFMVLPFPLLHDVPSVGFLIEHPEAGRFCFITDTKYTEFTFPGLQNIIVEANFCEDILEERVISGEEHKILGKRIRNSHMSIQTCKGFLKANDLSKVNNILLIHLSDRNSHAARFISEVEELTGCNVEVATNGLEMDFNINPF